jgi:hypothetical protein
MGARRRRSYSDSSGSESASDDECEKGRDGEEATDDPETYTWVMCDSCDKWRRVSAAYAQKVAKLKRW